MNAASLGPLALANRLDLKLGESSIFPRSDGYVACISGWKLCTAHGFEARQKKQ